MKVNLNETEAAERYGLSVHWFRRMRWAGGGPVFLKVGSRCLYPIDTTDEYFAAKSRRSTSDTGKGA